ncbi:MAG TPA: flagellin [Sandaracinaceae bacterium LLY-WYZ-13_1]|nr:flagellin [Sandaracinaceae bacterium LLY-WYZ-13_1]
MAITINTNIASLNAQRNLNATQHRLQGNFGRLSTGLRINQASDDAAGLGISEKLKSQIRSMSQAERNAQDGVSLLQTAEGAMNEVSGILTRMRELAVQSATDTVGATERGFINQEVSALQEELDRIAEVTEFNGAKLLDGSTTGTTFNFQVGIGATTNDQIAATIKGTKAADLGIVTGGAVSSVAGIDVSTATGATNALATIDAAINDVSSRRADIGSVQNRLQVTIANLGTARENLSAANSRIRDVDVAQETADMTRNNILMQAGTSVLAQANQAPQVALSLLG